MKIFVIRHGQTELNKKGLINGHLDDILTPAGIEQAKRAALFLPKTVNYIYSSSLARAKETANIINESFNVSLTFHDELKEVNFGVLNGTPFLDQYKKKHRMLDYDWRPSGESFEEVKMRVIGFLQKIKKESGHGEVLLVTHGGIIRLLHFLQFGELLNEIENTSLHSFDLNKILAKIQ